ncbi:ACT domain-containing protein [Catenovulum sp. SM1970]|uniref:glycine cleavage system protein R n=1 Tax=Marinifaba aquimaris TaxID=2741323 RepID=UPI001573853B|nr:ACT domain-containing protein [Marinifaba aquimaris]NTS77679.1 ACT domain-containing protein [Marinifaba aquimaris]
MKTYVVSVITQDKPGVIETLSNLISTKQGNWQASNFCQLAGQFAGIVEFSIEEAHASDVEQALTALNEQGFQLQIKQGEGADSQSPCSTIDITGNDKVGIVKEISSALARHHINVIKLTSTSEPAPNWGGNLFKAQVEVRSPSQQALEEAKDALEAIANDLIVDIELG